MKASKFLDANGIEIRETVSASKKLGKTDASAMAKAASTLASPASHPRPRKPRSGAARDTSGGKPRAADKGDE